MSRSGLTDQEIEDLGGRGQRMMEFARSVEAAVLARIDNSTMLIYGDCVWTKQKTEAKP